MLPAVPMLLHTHGTRLSDIHIQISVSHILSANTCLPVRSTTKPPPSIHLEQYWQRKYSSRALQGRKRTLKSSTSTVLYRVSEHVETFVKSTPIIISRTGLDMAVQYNGFVYHTKYDRFDVISRDSLQSTGDNLLSLVKSISNANEMRDIKVMQFLII